jgi:ferritin-like metal-binding protein YciE
MKLMSEKLPDLQSLYVKDLRLLLSAEEVIAMKMPFMIGSTSDAELKQVFRDHRLETEEQVKRIREILHELTGEADPLKCKVVYSMFDEIEDMAEDAGHEPVRDAAMLVEARRIEHYEIAAYGALLQFAQILGFDRHVQLLEQNSREESQADQRLGEIGARVYLTARTAA